MLFGMLCKATVGEASIIFVLKKPVLGEATVPVHNLTAWRLNSLLHGQLQRYLQSWPRDLQRDLYQDLPKALQRTAQRDCKAAEKLGRVVYPLHRIRSDIW